MSRQTVSIDRSRRWVIPVVVGVLVAVGAAVWWAGNAPPNTAPPPEPTGGTGPMASPFGSAKAGVPVDEKRSAEARPAWMNTGAGTESHLPELSKEEWAALRDATQGQNNSQAEMARLARFARFQKGFERWQSLREKSEAAAERTELARELLQSLGDHLERQEMMAGEALLVQAALLEDAEPDPARRQVALDQLKAQVERIVNKQRESMAPQEQKAQLQQQELERLQAEIIRKCQSEPSGSCDQKSLEGQLDAARVKVYGQQ